MKNEIIEVAKLLNYFGPSIEEIISSAITSGYSFAVTTENDVKILKVISVAPYELTITDTYYYNAENQLLKQTVKINNKEKIVFDKYSEALSILEKIEHTQEIAS